MKALKIIVTGKVQGVFFRKYTRDKAVELDIKGLVRNEPDGSVLIEAEGEERKLNEFVSWCREGSPAANVEDVKTEPQKPKGFSEFKIDY